MVWESSRCWTEFPAEWGGKLLSDPRPRPCLRLGTSPLHPEHILEAMTLLPACLPLETGCLALMSELSWPSLRMNAIRL